MLGPSAAQALPLPSNEAVDHVAHAQPLMSLESGLTRHALKAAWAPAAIKGISDEVTALQTTLRSSTVCWLRKNTFDNLLNKIPVEVQALYPRLHSLQAKVTQHTGDVVNKSLANELLDLLARLAANAEAWYESVLGQEAAVDHGC